MLQFSSSNPEVFYNSGALRAQIPESSEEREARKALFTGVELLPPTLDCSLAGLVAGLEQAGYTLVLASRQSRLSAQTNHAKRYHMARFVFVRSDEAVIPEGDLTYLARARELLESLCSDALWRARAYNNPLQDGRRGLSVNLEVRNPLLQPDGQAVLVWEKKDGKRVGTAPVPLAPENSLHVEGDHLILR